MGFSAPRTTRARSSRPLVAFALLQWLGLEIRAVFWLAAVPAVLVVITVITFVREGTAARGEAAESAQRDAQTAARGTALVPRSFWAYLSVVFVFTLGNSTDAFLLLRAHQLGVPIALAPILWATLHLVKSAASTHGGALSDRIGASAHAHRRLDRLHLRLSRLRGGVGAVARVGALHRVRIVLRTHRGDGTRPGRRLLTGREARDGIRLLPSDGRVGNAPGVGAFRVALESFRGARCVHRWCGAGGAGVAGHGRVAPANPSRARVIAAANRCGRLR